MLVHLGNFYFVTKILYSYKFTKTSFFQLLRDAYALICRINAHLGTCDLSINLMLGSVFRTTYCQILRPGTPKLQDTDHSIDIEYIQRKVTVKIFLSSVPQNNQQSALEYYYRMPFPFRQRQVSQPLPFCSCRENGLIFKLSLLTTE